MWEIIVQENSNIRGKLKWALTLLLNIAGNLTIFLSINL